MLFCKILGECAAARGPWLCCPTEGGGAVGFWQTARGIHFCNHALFESIFDLLRVSCHHCVKIVVALVSEIICACGYGGTVIVVHAVSTDFCSQQFARCRNSCAPTALQLQNTAQ